jgi:ABC-type transport system involved in cytochrome c biogenesis permease subunit
MSDVSFFWIGFGAYLGAMLALSVAALWRGGRAMAQVGRGLVWLGMLSQTTSIVWRSFAIGTEPLHQFVPRLRAAFTGGPGWQAWVYGLIFVVPVAAVVVGIVFRRRRLVWLLTAGLVVVLEMILMDFLDFMRMPIERPYEYLLLAAWCSALALLALSPMLRLVVIDAALAVAACLLTVFAAIQPKAIKLHLMPALQSYWLFIHVSVTSIAYAAFGIAFVVAALFLIKSYDPSAVEQGTKRRLFLASAIAKGITALLVLVLVLGGIVLPYRDVAYAPHQLAGRRATSETPEGGTQPATAGLPRAGAIQVVRYGSAILGVFGAAAYVLFWLAYPLLRPRSDRSGLGAFTFVVSSSAIFAACLALAAVVQPQENAIRRAYEQRNELVRLHNELMDDSDKLSRESTDEEIARLEKLSDQARQVLSKAQWLPLTFEDQTRLLDDPVYKTLQDLYDKAGAEWKLPIRYKDIKQIGRDAAAAARNTAAAAERLQFPASRDAVARAVDALADEGRRREEQALLPRTTDGQLAAFTGIAFLVAAPIGLALYLLLPGVSDRLPEAMRLDRISYAAVAVGYPVFTFGALFAGAIWAHFAWGSWWSWDPKEVGSLVAWVLYTVYLHQRYREGMSPRTAAVAAILGFLACTLSLAGNQFLGGLHAYS